jgi:hypothetical protein
MRTCDELLEIGDGSLERALLSFPRVDVVHAERFGSDGISYRIDLCAESVSTAA